MFYWTFKHSVHSVWKSSKMSYLNFWIFAFSTNFCPIKTDLSGSHVWPQAQVFKNSPNWTIFGIFNEFSSTQNNVNVTRFASNVECDFFCELQTPWVCLGSMMSKNLGKFIEQLAQLFLMVHSTATSCHHDQRFFSVRDDVVCIPCLLLLKKIEKAFFWLWQMVNCRGWEMIAPTFHGRHIFIMEIPQPLKSNYFKLYTHNKEKVSLLRVMSL